MVERAVTDGSKKRIPRTFEPPPWERDAFEELARKRKADEAAARELDEARARLRLAEEQRARAEKAAAKDVDPAVARVRALAEAEFALSQAAGLKESAEPAGLAEPAAHAGGDQIVTSLTAVAASAVATEPKVSAAPALDDDRVELMLARLSLEEPKMQEVHGLAIWSGVLLVVLGTAMLVLSIWWQVSGMRNGAALVQLLIQSLLVGGFGVGFAVLGGMIVYQSRRQARS